MAKLCSHFSQQGRENLHDKFQGIFLTAETTQANMSPSTWMTTLLNRSLTALVYSRNEHLLGKQYPCIKRSSAEMI